ncbi:MAG: imidazolonepropionase [bacterium]
MLTYLHNIGLLLNPEAEGNWEEIPNAAVLFDHEIRLVGAEAQIRAQLHNAAFKQIDAGGGLVTPGLVDSHTHPAFAEPRAAEFELRNQGRSYQEIAAAGGGIRSSVRSLQAISEDDLVLCMLPRLDQFLLYGTTTIEAKSGYGLSTENEIKQLRAIRRCQQIHPLDLVSTLLAAHEIPDEYRQNRERYLDVVVDEIIPAVAEEKLAVFCDAFCEEGVFSVEESRLVLETGKRYGLTPKIHADQLSRTGGAELAAELGAASADHLDYVSDSGIERMVQAGVVFGILPGAVIFLGLHRYPPVRRILEKGGSLALATDFNPGSSATQNLPLMMTLACVFGKLTAREALWAATRGGARSLRLEDSVGSLDSGKRADLVIWNCVDDRLIPYFFGMNLVKHVIKNGSQVIQNGQVVHSDTYDHK